ncbi:pyruvate kinase [Paraburkholderia phenoliruptrix]|uniref:pyruvate kinase n=1 Tax=Paraburkholderia phenoliruptrix TaxID=252970 RepID=UPI002869A560|nr:pyruvate kinase [Paraburkholderia phenoliruptrix]WMY09574.1 pyruvate kinase [Paraburkholderia phenoliruptrix]
MNRNRATKILATLGPSSSTDDVIERLYLSGADVFRLNMSHGSHSDHSDRLGAIRRVEARHARPIGVLLDLQGPKLRVAKFRDGQVNLSAGQTFCFDQDMSPGSQSRVCLPHPEIFAAAAVGDILLANDGLLRFRITSASLTSLSTEVLAGGVLSDRKGVNVPSAQLPIPALTEKDREDLRFGLELGVDWVALSFVQRAEDLREARNLIRGRAKLMAKIEKPSAVESIEAIIDAADGIMIARGDMGVELPPEDVPVIQKRIIGLCREAGKPVVVATQMLESMVNSTSPTRAEASDVATAVFDGADAVMLSAESASGRFPIDAVQMMNRVVERTEGAPSYREFLRAVRPPATSGTAEAISAAIFTITSRLCVSATVAYTTSGATASRIARERPASPILSLTPDQSVARQLALTWGTRPLQIEDAKDVEDMVSKATTAASQVGFDQNKPLLIAAGVPFGVPGTSNLLRIVWPS